MAKKKKSSPSQPPSNGIRELIWVDPASLDENPLNWRKHPQRQTDAIGASIKANGWADTLLYNENTGRLIDGHARRQVAIEEGLDSVPVLVGNWTEEQEKHLLATLDPLGAMAETDASALTTLTDMVKNDQESLKNLEKRDQEILGNVTQDLETYAFNVSTGADRETFLPSQEDEELEDYNEKDTTPVVDIVIDEEAYFPSSNEWGIPDLLEGEEFLADVTPDMTWDRSEESVSSDAWYCHSGRPFPEEREGGILGFFTEDYRFESIWNKKAKQAWKILDENWDGVCLPDYSIYTDEPFPIQLWNTYRQRWIGRFWQELGIPIIPIISGMTRSGSHKEWFLETLPKNPPVVASQVRTIGRGGKKYWRAKWNLIKDTIEIVKPRKFIIYGGLENKKHLGDLPKGTEYILLDAYMTKRRHSFQEK
jgi:hypothetical protein